MGNSKDELWILLLGLSIGDGTIHIRGDRLQLNHSIKQLEYLKYKKELLEQYDIYPEIHEYTSGEYSLCRFGFKHEYCKELRNILYPNDEKYISLDILNLLSDREIAIWYMDDGSLYVKKGKPGKSGDSYELVISTYCKTEEEALDIIKFLKLRYDADFTIKRNKGKFSVRCGKRAAIKFLNKIQIYICESMLYKTFM